MKHNSISHQFVDAIPSQLDDSTLYISLEFATAVHLCRCGCGLEVVTPISPTDWKMTFDGVSISLHPSIGNWSFPCRSHYWIRNNRIQWAGDMPNSTITHIRKADQENKEKASLHPAWPLRVWHKIKSLIPK